MHGPRLTNLQCMRQHSMLNEDPMILYSVLCNGEKHIMLMCCVYMTHVLLHKAPNHPFVRWAVSPRELTFLVYLSLSQQQSSPERPTALVTGPLTTRNHLFWKTAHSRAVQEYIPNAVEAAVEIQMKSGLWRGKFSFLLKLQGYPSTCMAVVMCRYSGISGRNL